MEAENRFRMLRFSQPERARELARAAQADIDRRWATYRAMAAPPTSAPPTSAPPSAGQEQEGQP
jgi:pyruvate-ferredoxin/flavodoxin oxidoreductase